MNYAIVKRNSWERKVVCSCGHLESRYYGDNCPKCKAPVFEYVRKFQNYTRFSYRQKEINDETAVFKNSIVDLPNKELNSLKCPTPVAYDSYEVIVDYRKHSVVIKNHGKVVDVTLDTCKRAMTGFDRYYLGSFLSEINYLVDGNNCGNIIYYFAQHPEVEVIYSTYESLAPLRNLTPNKGTKPHEIMGLSKPALKTYIDFIRNTHNYYDNMNKNMSYIRELDKLYEGKPDKFREFFDFMRRVNISDIPDLFNMCVNHKYDLERLEKYLTDDIYTYQGIDDPRVGFQVLSDYITICDKMGAPVDKYPKSLKLSHDIASKNLKIVISMREAEEFKETVSQKDYLKLKYKNDKYEVIIPEKAEDVIEEGRKLHHCVGAYVSRVRRGETKICFMREAGKLDLPLITLEVRNGKLTQYRGSCNRGPDSNEMKFIKEYAKAKNLPIV